MRLPALIIFAALCAHGSAIPADNARITGGAENKNAGSSVPLTLYQVPPGDPVHFLPFKPQDPALTSAVDIGTTTAAPTLYVAPFGIPGSISTTETRSFQHLLRFHLTPANFTDAKWINVLPDIWIQLPYQREDKRDEQLVRPRSAYLHDAELLESDIYLDGNFKTTSSGVDLQLYCRELKTGREEQLHEVAAEWSPALLSKAVTHVAQFCGLSNEDIKRSGLMDGCPSGSWAFLRDDSANAVPEFEAAARLDADCRFLYRRAAERAGHRAVDFINSGLQRFGKDARIIFAKSWCVATNSRGRAAMVLQAPLVKQWPQYFIFLGSYLNSCWSCYGQGDNSYAPPPDWSAAIEMEDNCLKLWPKNWGLMMHLAGTRRDLANHVRGSKTVDGVHPAAFALREKLGETAVEQIQRAAEIRPDCPQLLSDAVNLMFAFEHNELDQQERLLEQIVRIDPSNTEAESTIAYSHSAGWDDPRVGLMFIEKRLRARANNPDAYAALYHEFSNSIERIFGFNYSTRKKFLVKENPIVTKFIETGEKVIASGRPSSFKAHALLLESYVAIGEEKRATELAAEGKSAAFTYTYAKYLMDQKKYDEALKFSEAVQPRLATSWSQVTNQVLTFECLLGLKRNEDALIFAKNALQAQGDAAQCYHMVARALEELNRDLPSAVSYAEKAVQRSPEEDEYVNTLRRLQKKVKAAGH